MFPLKPSFTAGYVFSLLLHCEHEIVSLFFVKAILMMFRRFRKHPISCTGDLLIMNMIKMILVSGHSNFEVASGVALLLLPTTCLLLPTLDLGHVLLAKRMTLDHIDSQRNLVCFYSTMRMLL